MGSTWSSSSFLSSSSPSTSQLHIKDVLALCEDGDLLLAREKLADSALRVGVEFVVARDIQRMQRGQFPVQRVTSLPRSCELLLRYEGTLHVLSVGANGLQFTHFEERVTTKLPHIHDRYAIRRLRHDVRSDALSSELRELATQIASIAPVSWDVLMFPTVRVNKSPRSPRQQAVDREAIALNELPSLVRRLLRRMLELFCQGLQLEAASLPSDKQQITSKRTEEGSSTNSSRNLLSGPMNLKVENDASTTLRIALETLGGAEVTARLSAAFVAAVYEHICILDPIAADRSDPLLPAAFWSRNTDLVLSPTTALGLELAFIKATK